MEGQTSKSRNGPEPKLNLAKSSFDNRPAFRRSNTRRLAQHRVHPGLPAFATCAEPAHAANFTSSVSPTQASTFITVLIVGFPFGPNAA
jgi:hypothetical protein